MSVFAVIKRGESERPMGYSWTEHKHEASHTVIQMTFLNFAIESYEQDFLGVSSSQSSKHLSETADRAVSENVLTIGTRAP